MHGGMLMHTCDKPVTGVLNPDEFPWLRVSHWNQDYGEVCADYTLRLKKELGADITWCLPEKPRSL